MSSRALWEVVPRAKALGLLGWHIRWCLPWQDYQDPNCWHYTTDNWGDKIVYSTRAEAIAEAAMNCQHNLDMFGETSELMIRTRLGKWGKDRRTYGNDPTGGG